MLRFRSIWSKKGYISALNPCPLNLKTAPIVQFELHPIMTEP
ncbi:hypothetical protein HMPREF1870_01123 [Bacteroidales bacterium KA00344]|nr:hypothetical protein HMPREF1870_01123 [Bacteroidales bacterium KA00344]